MTPHLVNGKSRLFVLAALAFFLSACQLAVVPTVTQMEPARLSTEPAAAPAQAAVELTPTAGEQVETTSPSTVLTPDGSVQLILAAQHGGVATALAVSPTGETAFVAYGPSILPLSVSDSDQVQVIGSAFSLNAIASDLALAGDFLYLIDRQAHLLVFHVSDPATMYVLQAFEGAGSSRLFLQGERAFTSSDDCREGRCTSVLKLFSPDSLLESPGGIGPEGYGPLLPVMAQLDVSGSVEAVTADDRFVYIAHQNGLLVASLPDLQPVAEYQSEWVSGAAFDLPFAYLTGNHFTQLDLSDPASPVPVLVDAQMFLSEPLAILGEQLYAFSTFGEFGFCTSALQVIQLADLGSDIWTVGAGTDLGLACARKVQAAGKRLFVLDWDGLVVVDLSEPGNPRRLGGVANTPSAVEVVVDGIVFSGSQRSPASLWLHDTRDLQAIHSYGPFEPRWATDLALSGSILYSPVWQEGLVILDVSQPLSPVVIARINPEQLQGPGLDAAVRGSFLYVAREENGVAVFDVSRPGEPSLVGGFVPPQPGDAWLRTVRVTAGEAFAVALEEVSRNDQIAFQLRLLSLADPAHPEDAGVADIGQSFTHTDLEENGRHAFVMVSGCDSAGTCNSRILLVDLNTGLQVGSLELAVEAFDLFASGDFLYTAAGYDGLYVWDVSDPSSPFLAAHVLPGDPLHMGLAQHVAADGEWVYLSEPDGGLFIYQQSP